MRLPDTGVAIAAIVAPPPDVAPRSHALLAVWRSTLKTPSLLLMRHTLSSSSTCSVLGARPLRKTLLGRALASHRRSVLSLLPAFVASSFHGLRVFSTAHLSGDSRRRSFDHPTNMFLACCCRLLQRFPKRRLHVKNKSCSQGPRCMKLAVKPVEAIVHGFSTITLRACSPAEFVIRNKGRIEISSGHFTIRRSCMSIRQRV